MAEKEFTQTQIRLPAALYNELKESAEENFRSLNGELLFWIQLGMGHFSKQVYKWVYELTRTGISN